MLVKSEVIAAICAALSDGQVSSAREILERDYPFAPRVVTKRRFCPLEYTRVFIRDGFVDRYSGERLVFPPLLRMVSRVLGDRFPFHPNWKTDATHPAYWELGATIDHLVPVSRGGADDPSNWVTTSMAHNSAKMNWTLEQVGWKLHPTGDYREWDGGLQWCLAYAMQHPDAVTDNTMRRWILAARTAHGEQVSAGKLRVLSEHSGADGRPESTGRSRAESRPRDP